MMTGNDIHNLAKYSYNVTYREFARDLGLSEDYYSKELFTLLQKDMMRFLMRLDSHKLQLLAAAVLEFGVEVSETEFGHDDFVCRCGNRADLEGFLPSVNGEEIEPTPDSGWKGEYSCGYCGHIYYNK
jgi:redox-regulated HSP33 family molecular chaperone